LLFKNYFFCFFICLLRLFLFLFLYTLLFLFLSISTFTSLFFKLFKFLNTPLKLFLFLPCFLTYFFNLYHHNQLAFSSNNPRHSSFASSSPPWRISSGFPCSLYLLSLNGFRTKIFYEIGFLKVTNIFFSSLKIEIFKTAKLKKIQEILNTFIKSFL